MYLAFMVTFIGAVALVCLFRILEVLKSINRKLRDINKFIEED